MVLLGLLYLLTPGTGRDSVMEAFVVEPPRDGWLIVESDQTDGPIRFRVRDGVVVEAQGRGVVPLSALSPGTRVEVAFRSVGERRFVITRVRLIDTFVRRRQTEGTEVP